jgi:hypothetical protein
MKKFTRTIAVFFAATLSLLLMASCVKKDDTIDTECPLAPMVNTMSQVAANNQMLVSAYQKVIDETDRTKQIALDTKSKSLEKYLGKQNEELVERVLLCAAKLQQLTIPCVVDDDLEVTIPDEARFDTVDTDGRVAVITIVAQPSAPVEGPLWFILEDAHGEAVANSIARPQEDGSLSLNLILTTNTGAESLQKLASATTLHLSAHQPEAETAAE